MACIYMITNTKNNKKYIGFTTQPIGYRLRQHRNKSSKCPKIRNAIQKYGWDSFKWEILKESEDVDYLLNVVENEMILKHNPEYNMTIGGDGALGNHAPKPKNRVPVVQYSIGGKFIREWNSAKEAGKALDIIQSSITHVCKKDHGSVCAGGFQWRYKSDLLMFLTPTRLRNNKQAVKNIGNGIIYESVQDAAKNNNMCKSMMVQRCKKQNGYMYWHHQND